MEVKKTGKGLKVLAGILAILLIAAIGYIVVDKFILNKAGNNTTNTVVNKESGTQAETKTIEATETEQNIKNDYSLFVKKMKEERTRLFSNNNDVSLNETIGGYELSNGEQSYCYTLNLDKDGTLGFYQCVLSEKQEIAKNVLFYRVVDVDGDYKKLFYVTEDGFVYSFDIQKVVKETRDNPNPNVDVKPVKQTSAKEIVNIVPGNPVYFVDINGNIYKD